MERARFGLSSAVVFGVVIAVLETFAVRCLLLRSEAGCRSPTKPLPSIVAEGRPLRAGGRWRAVPDAGCAGEQFKRVAGVSRQGLARCGDAACQYRRASNLLGADRADARASSTSAVVDLILKQAREHHLRLVLLWFGTWKNGSSHYTPEWIKLNQEKYPFVCERKGRNGGLAITFLRRVPRGGQGCVSRC